MLSAISQAWASCKTAPGVALLAVVAFAVRIGAATAIFTVIHGVLLRPLPYRDAGYFIAAVVSPLLAAIVMSFSSVAVIANANRLKRWRARAV